jgi:hypothetical protein
MVAKANAEARFHGTPALVPKLDVQLDGVCFTPETGRDQGWVLTAGIDP